MKNFYLVENSSKASAAAAGKRIARYLEHLYEQEKSEEEEEAIKEPAE